MGWLHVGHAYQVNNYPYKLVALLSLCVSIKLVGDKIRCFEWLRGELVSGAFTSDSLYLINGCGTKLVAPII